MVSNVGCISIIKIFCRLFENHTEEDREESQCQDATLLYIVGDWERLIEVTCVLLGHTGLHAVGWSCLRTLEDNKVVPWCTTFLLCSLYQMLLTDQQTLRRAPCFAPSTSLGAEGEPTCLQGSNWLWSCIGSQEILIKSNTKISYFYQNFQFLMIPQNALKEKKKKAKTNTFIFHTHKANFCIQYVKINPFYRSVLFIYDRC